MKGRKKREGYRFLWLAALLPAGLALTALCRAHPAATETVYARRIYPALSAVISPVFGIFPFSMAEVILAALLVLVILGAVRAFRRGPRGVLRGGLWLVCLFCTGYFLFYALWGLNYFREPVTKSMGLKTGAPTAAELDAVTNREIAAINALCPQLSYDKAGQSVYAGGFAAMRGQVNAGYDAMESDKIPSRRLIPRTRAWPKSFFPAGLMPYTGTQGIFIPFTLEPTVETGYPAFILPFTISHEAAHFKGFAREDEANYLAFLACQSNPDVYFQYSGHMNALVYLSNALYTTDPARWQAAGAKLDRGAAADLNAYNEYLTRHAGKISDTADRINDSYLKAQGQPGVVSYDNFVLLLCDDYRTKGR